ncbi:MAG: M1 family aminopeptidase [Mycobacteriales bacterium]
MPSPWARHAVPAMLGIALLTLAAGCRPTGAPSARPSPSVASPTPSAPPPATASAAESPAPACSPTAPRSAYAAPDPRRPVVDVAFSVARDHASFIGHEHIVFTPDLPVRELVFRLWGNAPRPARAGGEQRVTAVRGAGVRRFAVARGGGVAGHAGTLLRVALQPVARGNRVTVDIDFTMRLPSGVNERFGHRGGTAWFASAFPLLAWERRHGWATEPATAQFAEATTSEVFRLRGLTVETVAGDTVLATGTDGAVDDVAGGRRRWHFSATAVRDIAVAVGQFRTLTTRGAVPVTVGVAPGLGDSPATVGQLAQAALAVHAERFGPFAFGQLDIAVVPDITGGIEYPGAILLGTRQLDATLSHEIAHQWFYGLVGNDQARDPWLDEAFATYAEALHHGTARRYQSAAVPPAGRQRVGRPMTYWERLGRTYFRAVYLQGASALVAARQAAGTASFDAAIRCYVARNAHRIATPGDLANALRELPAARAVLVRAGALPPGA